MSNCPSCEDYHAELRARFIELNARGAAPKAGNRRIWAKQQLSDDDRRRLRGVVAKPDRWVEQNWTCELRPAARALLAAAVKAVGGGTPLAIAGQRLIATESVAERLIDGLDAGSFGKAISKSWRRDRTGLDTGAAAALLQGALDYLRAARRVTYEALRDLVEEVQPVLNLQAPVSAGSPETGPPRSLLDTVTDPGPGPERVVEEWTVQFAPSAASLIGDIVRRLLADLVSVRASSRVVDVGGLRQLVEHHLDIAAAEAGAPRWLEDLTRRPAVVNGLVDAALQHVAADDTLGDAPSDSQAGSVRLGDRTIRPPLPGGLSRVPTSPATRNHGE